MIIEPKHHSLLARLFSNPVVGELASRRRSRLLDYVLRHSGLSRSSGGATLGQMLEEIYWLLWRHYRCEYVYKNALVSKILLGRHSLNTSTLLTEFRTGTSKADLVIVNGTSTVYEIKTELDSLDRLGSQLGSYLRVFDKVYVVTHESQVPKIEREVASPVGILLLTDRYRFSKIRDAKHNAVNVDPASIFGCLHQAEYCRVIKSEFGFVPDVPNSLIYTECKRLFATLRPEVAHRYLIEALRRRAAGTALPEFVGSVPLSLKLLSLAQKLTFAQRATFLSALQAEYKLN